MRRIVITLPFFTDGEASRIVGMLDTGADYVHIRKPEATAADIAGLLEAIPAQYRKRLTLHDHFGLAEEYGIGGLHLNRRNPEAPDGFSGRVSVSCHSIDELFRHPEADYLFLSPIFDSISKEGYKGRFCAEQVRETLADARLRGRVVALGGIMPSRFASLEELGFCGGAMLGAAWKPVDLSKFALQLITHPKSGEDPVESVAGGVRDALAGGCRWVQLRMKDADDNQILTTARIIEPLCHSCGAVLILDDRVHLVVAARADGVHLGKNDMPVAEAKRLLGPGYIIGATANTFEDIARAYCAGADYIGLGPLRFTTTKKNLSPVLGTEGYERICGECRRSGTYIPIVAIGSVRTDDVEPLFAAGAAGVAVSGSILNAADPREATEQFITKINHINR